LDKSKRLSSDLPVVTLGQWLKKAEAMYARHGAALGQISTNARDEALYLLLSTVGLRLDSGAAALRRRMTDAESKEIESVLRRRLVDHEPAAYITGEAWLGGLRFLVDDRVLIPRSYFVEILETQVDPWLQASAPVTRVADVCTGSGCLAVLLARHFTGARVDATDISPGALEVAEKNISLHALGRRVRPIRSDLLTQVPAGRYDVILSNPPYEPTSHVKRLPLEFRKEPRLALDGGPDGMVLIRRLVRQAARRLRPKGVLMIEVGGLRDAFEREFSRLQPHWFHTDDGSDCVCLIQAQRLARAR
jgi:ribosomal protein L3 glutamine methyltransferase